MDMSVSSSRRNFFLAAAGAAAAIPLIGHLSSLFAKEKPRTLGLIVPPGDIVPPEPLQMYSQGFRFISKGLGLEQLSVKGYASVIDRVTELSKILASQGAEAIVLMGTSLSFFRGVAFDDELIGTMKSASGGLPATTMSRAVVDSLRGLNARRLAVATAYVDEVNATLATYMTQSGFEVGPIRSLQLGDVAKVLQVKEEEIMQVGKDAVAANPSADALFISCGGLRTLDLLQPLEKATGKPVVSSATAGAWGGVRLLGHSGAVEGFGCQLASPGGCAVRST